MKLTSCIKFIKGRGDKKYSSIIPPIKKFPRWKRVSFGHKSYEQFKDSVTKKLGGGLWSHKNHGDKKRRSNYRKRHGGMKCKNGDICYKIKYSPSWFSYYFLWWF